MTQPIYAIGDIHGRLGLLHQALERIERDGGADAPVVFIGDYCDRGPQSSDVIQLLIDGQAEGRDWTCLMGNHDRMFAMFLEDYPRNDARLLVGYHWLHDRLGGLETLRSYGVDVPEGSRIYEVHAELRSAVPAAHKEFLLGLPYWRAADDVLFVHAGIRPGVPIEAQDPDDLVWIREEFLGDRTDHGPLVVHGHTAIQAATHHGNRINIDSGAAYGRDLTTVVLEGRQCWTLTEAGREILAPG